jgi:hypothetical protein
MPGQEQGETSNKSRVVPPGWWASECLQRTTLRARETRGGEEGDLEPASREGQVGPRRESERSVVPQDESVAHGMSRDERRRRKPGNAGGGKGPWFRSSVGSGEGREIGRWA